MKVGALIRSVGLTALAALATAAAVVATPAPASAAPIPGNHGCMGPWVGRGQNSGSSSYWTIDLTLTGAPHGARCGTIEYRNPDCGGYLDECRLVGADIHTQENYTHRDADCAPAGRVIIRCEGNQMRYSWIGWEQVDTLLRRPEGYVAPAAAAGTPSGNQPPAPGPGPGQPPVPPQPPTHQPQLQPQPGPGQVPTPTPGETPPGTPPEKSGGCGCAAGGPGLPFGAAGLLPGVLTVLLVPLVFRRRRR